MVKKSFRVLALLGVCLLLLGGGTQTAKAENKNVSAEEKQTIFTLSLEDGPVLIQLRPDLAPNHVARIRKLANSGFYDGVIFHRVIDGFMAQTGDPTGTGTGGSGQHIKAEFTQEPFERGTVGMARANHPDSADSQFFITFAKSSFLNGQYTVIGNVISGMEHVDEINRGEPPANPDKIVWAKVLTKEQAQMETELEAPDFIDGEQEPGTHRFVPLHQ